MSSLLVWMRDEISKWLMRTQNAGRLLNIPLRATTASSVLTLALQETILAEYTVYVMVFFALGIGVFIWAYDRFQVMNMQSRHDADRSDNFTGPTTAINQLINTRQQAVQSKAIAENWEIEKTEKELRRVTEEALQDYRNGINMGDFQ